MSQDGKFITLMLYDNMLKIIPLVHKSEGHTGGFPVQLSNAINLRVRHSDVTDVIPLINDSREPCFAVLYQRMEHSVV